MHDPSNPRNAGKPKGLYPKPPHTGRQKGTKNKKTLAREAEIKSLASELKKRRFDPIREIVKLYEEGDTTTDQRITLLTMIMDRISPKLAAIKVEPRIESEDSEVVLEAVRDADTEQLLKSIEESEK